MNSKKIKVLIVDDSLIFQELLKHIIEKDPMLEVIGMAKDGVEALQIISWNKPDVITMDICMPRMDGYEATKQIMSTTPIPILIMSGKYKPDDADFSFKALECGALAILEKPSSPDDFHYEELSKTIATTIKSISQIRLITRRYIKATSNTTPRHIPPQFFPKNGHPKIGAIAIGTSIGGPLALKEILSNISPNLPVPIFIVQHIMEGYVQDFAHWLSGFSKLPIIVPADHEPIIEGKVYLAPNGYDMIIQSDMTIHLSCEPSNKANKPSVAKLFESVKNVYQKKAVGIILTGMGEDGSNELLKLKEAGALTIAQDEGSSLVFGMPGKAIELGAARYILSIEQIAPFLNECLVGNHIA
jgi:two-component system chemotaxis response regulator CheB